MSLAPSLRSIFRIGPRMLPGLLCRKLAKRVRYKWMLRTLHRSKVIARWRGVAPFQYNEYLETDRAHIIERADAMLRDENIFFTFPYQLRTIERPWEYDPLEKKYWPRRYYSERVLHATDTPRDVKIVWEINRFKDLPALAQAALLTEESKYAEEAERRMISWIEENPMASSINWASALEISIRLISWTTTIALLTGETIPNSFLKKEKEIGRSIYKQACYLAGDLSTDKIVPTNHLIGEAAGLYIIASLWDFPSSRRFARRAKRILSREMLRQTFPDGVTREASSWYHLFVTDFCDLAGRVAELTGDKFEEAFHARLADMKAYLEKMTMAGNVVRYGDADDGWALFLEGDSNAWKCAIFGSSPTTSTTPSIDFYPEAKVVATHVKNAFLFLRAGEFGMGGGGFSSHAHDDFLSPIVHLDGLPVLADPGTFVYNGDPKCRALYRDAFAHNGIVFGKETGAKQRMNFGWNRVRPDARILKADFTGNDAIVSAQYGEWPQHRRIVKIKSGSLILSDRFDQSAGWPCTWLLHLAPEWKIVKEASGEYLFQNARGNYLSVKLRGNFDTIELVPYDFSPSYRVAIPGTMLQLSAMNPSGDYAMLFATEFAP